jgi:hypothetical protein
MWKDVIARVIDDPDPDYWRSQIGAELFDGIMRAYAKAIDKRGRR